MLWTPGEEACFQDFGRQFDQLIMDRWKSRLRMVKPPDKKRANENLVTLIGASDVYHFRNRILLLDAGRMTRWGIFVLWSFSQKDRRRNYQSLSLNSL